MLLLYTQEHCAFSKKVIAKAEELGIELVLKDISEKENKDVMMAKGGKEETPFLVDENRNIAMYDSDDINAYLEEHYANR